MDAYASARRRGYAATALWFDCTPRKVVHGSQVFHDQIESTRLNVYETR